MAATRLLLATAALFQFPAAAEWQRVVFPSPTEEPGRNQYGKAVISGGMPVGNGELAALVFPLQKPLSAPLDAAKNNFSLSVGVHLWLGMTTAMASDMQVMPLGVVSIETEPPLGSGGFQQTLDMEKGLVTVSTKVGRVDVWVDAAANRAVARVQGTGGARLAVRARAVSLRPQQRFSYYGRCNVPTSAPDELFSANDSVGLSHRNLDEDVVLFNQSGGIFATTLRQQGMANFTNSLKAVDAWSGRQFGFQVSGKGLQLSSDGELAGAGEAVDVVVTGLAAQAASSAEWREAIDKLHAEHARADLEQVWRQHVAWWGEFWARSHIFVRGSETLELLTERYAQTRYLQAIQAGTWLPIKFNGMLFTAQLPPDETSDQKPHAGGGPDYRGGGSSNWWQNIRLAYWNMAASGDFEKFASIFEYHFRMLPFLRARTQAAFNHSGVYLTETSTYFGAYDPCDYGQFADKRARGDLNFGYEYNRYIRFDFGGDGGLTELGVMLLDHFAYSLDEETLQKYLPLLSETLEFFAWHYGDVRKQKLHLFPTQALETYQCWTLPATPENCPTNDHPTLAALHVLTERALQLPEALTTVEQRDLWRALRAALPEVPLVEEEGRTVVSPYESYPAAQNIGNCETPELYSTHPFRYFTRAAELAAGRDIKPSVFCLEESKRRTCRNSDQNRGWVQGVLNAALLGRARMAARMVLDRASIKPAQGFRFPAFAPHFQDYQPSEDHFANMNTALQLMLLAPADDGLDKGGALLFPAWPCEWDVDFKLAAPRRTVVQGSFKGGRLESLVVSPPERRSAIRVLPCQNVTETEAGALYV